MARLRPTWYLICWTTRTFSLLFAVRSSSTRGAFRRHGLSVVCRGTSWTGKRLSNRNGASALAVEDAACNFRLSTSLDLIQTAPFHFDGTVFNPSHSPARTSDWEPGRRWQTLRWDASKLWPPVPGQRDDGAPMCVRLMAFFRNKPSGHPEGNLRRDQVNRGVFTSLESPPLNLLSLLVRISIKNEVTECH